jgi:small subunit ribosomal protein S2
MARLEMRNLIEAGAHFGHQTARWNPKMRPYIYGARNGVHIIDLSQTVRLFEDAANFAANVVSNGRHVLYVGTKKQAQSIVREEASRAKQYFITNRWLGGTLTNWKTIQISINRLKELDRLVADGSLEKYTKKEALMLTREREKLERNIGGIKDMNDRPAALFVIDPKKEEIAIKEARRLHIPVIALTDTNCDPDGVDYVVPANDDAIRSIQIFTAAFSDACLEGGRRAGTNRRSEDLTTASFDDGRVVTSDKSAAEVVRKPSTQPEA